jgi:CheY-like chemotaxis protein
MTNAALRADTAGCVEETILVLEREVLTRAFLSDYLRSCGYRVLEARSAAEALTVLQ